jgi:hypothetical protein
LGHGFNGVLVKRYLKRIRDCQWWILELLRHHRLCLLIQ